MKFTYFLLKLVQCLFFFSVVLHFFQFISFRKGKNSECEWMKTEEKHVTQFAFYLAFCYYALSHEKCERNIKFDESIFFSSCLFIIIYLFMCLGGAYSIQHTTIRHCHKMHCELIITAWGLPSFFYGSKLWRWFNQEKGKFTIFFFESKLNALVYTPSKVENWK